MRKRRVIILSLLLCLCMLVFCACSKGSTNVDPEKPDDNNQDVVPSKIVNVTAGFENEDDSLIFVGGNGAELSINSDNRYVHTGVKSLKVAVSTFANAEFSFSENISEKVITGYDYLSFWVYSDFDGTLAITNSSVYSNGSGSFLVSGIEKYTWTKVKIEKGSDAYEIMQYNLSFNNFILMATGKDFGNVVSYNLYIDDVRLYKSGDSGECEMVMNFDGNIQSEMPVAEAGTEYTLPTMSVYSPEGYGIANADASCTKAVYDSDGNNVSIVDGKVKIDKCGTYTYECSYTYDGIENKFIADFDVIFATINEFYVGTATKGEAYSVVNPTLVKVNTDEVLGDVTSTVAVVSPSGVEVKVDGGKFTPDVCGAWTVKYNFTRTVNGVENSQQTTKELLVMPVSGLVNDFSGESTSGLHIGDSVANISLKLSNEKYKAALNGNTQSLKISSSGKNTVAIELGDSFPYKNADGKKYLSMWVYNGASIDVAIEITAVKGSKTLKAGAWNYCVFKNSDFIGDFAGSEILFYDEKTHSKLSCDFYIDDIRLIAEGDAEEIVFADKVCACEYDEATKVGTRYAINTEYEIDTTLKDADGNVLTQKATVVSVLNKRNKTVKIENANHFTPKLVGRHTITLQYENDGILCTSEKTIDVLDQFLISPDDDFILLPGEKNVAYNFNEVPVIWNHGAVDSTISPEIIVYDPNSQEVSVTSNAFTPTNTGHYTVIFMVKDTSTKESALLECDLAVYDTGKKGVVADFENGDISMMESTTYYYGAVSNFGLSNKYAHNGQYSAAFSSASDDTRELKFGLTEGNIAGDISRSKYVSFWVYIEDSNLENNYFISKTAYGGWINETDKNYVTGSLRMTIKQNTWVEVKIERKDYESVLGGTIFAGYTFNVGGSMWAAQDNDFITMFSIQRKEEGKDLGGTIKKGVTVYIDDFTIGY